MPSPGTRPITARADSGSAAVGEDATALDWVRGDALHLDFPAHAAALADGGAGFLTAAFRAAGALSTGNQVARITRCEECPGGSTGRKLLLSVTYDQPAPDLQTDLFVKFSRDFDDPLRDRARFQMEREIRFALLSRAPDFPIAVARCYFADYHAASGTGILVAARVPFGEHGIAPHQPKCRDDELPDALAHYRALVTALARLAGTDRAGSLPTSVETGFPWDPASLAVSRRQPYTPEQIASRVARYGEFAAAYPGLLPANIRAPAFLARLADEAPRLQAVQGTVQQLLGSRPEHIALCHWNANIDNAWFWRDAHGDLQCGLLDWGNASRMNVAMALWGCLSGAELALWDDHLQQLLELFTAEFSAAGGPALDTQELERHLFLYAASMGLAWLLDVPSTLAARVPDLATVTDRRDPRIREDEAARTQLQMLAVFLNLWERRNVEHLLARLATGAMVP